MYVCVEYEASSALNVFRKLWYIDTSYNMQCLKWVCVYVFTMPNKMWMLGEGRRVCCDGVVVIVVVVVEGGNESGGKMRMMMMVYVHVVRKRDTRDGMFKQQQHSLAAEVLMLKALMKPRMMMNTD